MTPNPDGWSRNPDNTWTPPLRALQSPPESQTEVPPNVKKSTIRDGAVEVRDAEDDLVVRMGKLSDGSYGLELLEGGLIIQRLANTSLTINNAAGNTIITLGQESDGDANLTIFNDAGVKQVVVGEDGADFDVKVFDATGTEVKLSTLAFGLASEETGASEARTSSAYGDLATVGPTVTANIGPSGRALVSVSYFADKTNSMTGSFMSYAVSGASTVAAADSRAAFVDLSTGGAYTLSGYWTRTRVITGLTAGSNTFTAKYRGVSNVVTTVNYTERVIVVQPF